MKNLAVLSAFAFFFIAPMSFAQKGEGNHEMSEEKKMNHLEKELDLSKEQREKIEAIHIKYGPQEASNKKEMEKLRAEKKEINKAKKAEVKAILTPEQLKKMEELKEEHQAKKQSARKENRKERMDTEEN
jgi:Spy/CpxP family protein refolding chaperone